MARLLHPSRSRRRHPGQEVGIRITRRGFIGALVLAGAGGIALDSVLGRARRPGRLFLARRPGGVWGVTEDPAEAAGALLPGPGGVLGIAPGEPGGRILVRRADGVTLIHP